jgi:starch phosphorylase
MHIETRHSETAEARHFFQVQVLPGDLSSCDLSVELYADPRGEQDAEIVTMTAGDPPSDDKAPVTYHVDIPATRAPGDYTARVVPHHPNVAVPLEAAEILWQR